MTENNKVSALAFAVLILGMLGFCIALAADLFFSPSAPAVVAPATPTLPRELQNKVMQDFARAGGGVHQKSEFNVAGRGLVLPEEQKQRIEELVRYQASYEHASPSLQDQDGRELRGRCWIIE